MQTILLPYVDDVTSRSALKTAQAIARMFNAYVEGLFVEELPHIIGGEGMTLPPEYLTRLDEERAQRASSARDHFIKAMSDAGFPMGGVGGPGDQVAAGWRETGGQESHVIGDYGRLFDLIVIGRPGDGAPGAWEFACEAALFESGRPVLLAPANPPAEIGRRVTVAWNGSTETARTIAVSMPLLHRAEAVEVLSIEGALVPGPTSEQVGLHLQRNGIKATARHVQVPGRNAGEIFLEEASKFSADLMVKGAYTQSRLRQLIFGGPTRHILSAAEIPVLLAH